ncbi:F-box protein SKIP23-like [Elaeis guineensis]|uniref:F-box protein SKIP23-like n=1 Tax=Elaeis guineensis var. tenera TaxID=51953 RepID=A0A6I9S8Z9_ELAGV|nr:F-box protein SKIP23-like [Elaeis guineensis]
MDSPDWATLIPDLLHRISQKLLPCSFDYVSFRSTCPGWRSAAPRVNFAPLLMFPFDPNAGTLSFYSPSDDKLHSFSFPEATSTVFCGSSHGWLLLMDQAASISLLNPFTRKRIHLPPADEELALASLNRVSKVGTRWISHSEDGTLTPLGLSDMQQVFIDEAVLSSAPDSGGDFIVMATLALSTQVAYCRRSDSKWTLLETNLPCNVKSVTYYDGRFFVMDCAGEIAVLGVDFRGKVVLLASMETPNGHFNCKLVESRGVLLLVGLVIDFVDEENLDLQSEFEVYRFNPGGERMWCRVESIGDQTLFLSLRSSSNVAGRTLSKCRVNSIYYSAQNFEANMPVAPGRHHMEVVNLADGSSELVPCHVPSEGAEPAAWFQPNLNVWEL